MNDKNSTVDPQENLKSIAENVYLLWEEALKNNDVKGLLTLYANDAMLESPLIPYILQTQNGICKGHEELKIFFDKVMQRKPSIRRFYKQNLFTNGKTLFFEYPYQTPEGEQMDFAEVMEIKEGLIQHHKVYWGWRGVKVLQDDLYWR